MSNQGGIFMGKFLTYFKKGTHLDVTVIPKTVSDPNEIWLHQFLTGIYL